MKSIAFFDVDGTILNGYSGYYTTLELIRRNILKLRRLPQAIFYKTISTIYYGDVHKMYEVAIQDMAGSHIDEILKIGRYVFEKYLKEKLFVDALKRIEEHRKKGDKIILISSGPYMTIKIIEEYLKADDSFSIGPVIKEGILQNYLIKPFCFMEGKVEIATEQAAKEKIDLKDCYFYADSIHDIHLLSNVGKPFVVNPDRKLKKEAAKHDWPILNFEKCLGETQVISRY